MRYRERHCATSRMFMLSFFLRAVTTSISESFLGLCVAYSLFAKTSGGTCARRDRQTDKGGVARATCRIALPGFFLVHECMMLRASVSHAGHGYDALGAILDKIRALCDEIQNHMEWIVYPCQLRFILVLLG